MLELLLTCSDFNSRLVLVRVCGASVNETTLEEASESTESRSGSIMSLIVAKTGERMFKKYSEKVKVEDAIKRSRDDEEYDAQIHSFFVENKGPNRDEEIFKILDLFFKHHSKMPLNLELPKDQKFGSLLHYFAAVGDARVIQKLVSEPIGYPPDLENAAGYTPLLVALNNRCAYAVSQLLEYNVDVKKKDPATKLTPLQLLCEKEFRYSPRCGEIVDKMLEKGIYFLKFWLRMMENRFLILIYFQNQNSFYDKQGNCLYLSTYTSTDNTTPLQMHTRTEQRDLHIFLYNVELNFYLLYTRL